MCHIYVFIHPTRNMFWYIFYSDPFKIYRINKFHPFNTNYSACVCTTGACGATGASIFSSNSSSSDFTLKR